MKMTIFNTPAIITELHPELATAAPTRPPTRVCEELDGSPSHHVARFHEMAAKSAAAITLRFITSGLMTPFPIVEATACEKNRKATKLNIAAIMTAAKGDNTFVETTVAIEFDES
jgi:hypothetical protein